MAAGRPLLRVLPGGREVGSAIRTDRSRLLELVSEPLELQFSSGRSLDEPAQLDGRGPASHAARQVGLVAFDLTAGVEVEWADAVLGVFRGVRDPESLHVVLAPGPTRGH